MLTITDLIAVLALCATYIW